MITRDLPGSISVDVCWHEGRIIAARHSGAGLIVEAFAPDALEHGAPQELASIAMPGGNAAARIASHAGALFLAYRDAGDAGHLVRLDTGEAWELGLVIGQRPFAIGDGHCAYIFDNPARTAHVRRLEDPGALDPSQDWRFGDFVPTGLSHMEGARPVSWDSMLTMALWGVCFVRSGPFLIAQHRRDQGLEGAIEGHPGRLWIWRDALMNDQRAAADGPRAAVIAWSPGRPARLGLVSAADLEALPARPAPIPLEQIESLAGELLVAWYEQKGPPGSLPPGNAEIAIRDYPPGVIRPRPVLAMMDNFANITVREGAGRHSPPFAVQLGSEERHHEAGMREIEGWAWELHNRGIRPFVYWDDRRAPRPFRLPPGSVFAFMAYCGKDEALEAFYQDCDRALEEFSRDYEFLMMACQTHNTNPALLEEPSRALPAYISLIKKHRREAGGKLIGVSIFNNSGRDYPDGSKGGLTAQPWLRPHWEKALGRCTFPAWLRPREDGGNVSEGPSVKIIDFDRRVSRRDPRGQLIRFDITSERAIRRIAVGLTDGDELFEFSITSARKDGRYGRAWAHKPVINGDHRVIVRAWDDQDRMGEAVSTETVNVNEDPIGPIEEPEDPDLEDLADQKELVARVRRELYPSLEGRRLDDTGAKDNEGRPILDERLGHERQARIAYAVAWELRFYGIGVVAAKPGSSNWGGKRPEIPEGITTDALALPDGMHWDIAIDGAGEGRADWRLVPKINDEGGDNYEPIKARYRMAVQP